MEIRLGDTAFVDDLIDFLWEHRMLAVRTGESTLDVFDPSGDPGALERTLAVWRESRAADVARA